MDLYRGSFPTSLNCFKVFVKTELYTLLNFCIYNFQVNEGNIVRLSYAQVAQHHKEKAERDKQTTALVNTDEETKKDSVPQPKGI